MSLQLAILVDDSNRGLEAPTINVAEYSAHNADSLSLRDFVIVVSLFVAHIVIVVENFEESHRN